jgi:hypothetical protein
VGIDDSSCLVNLLSGENSSADASGKHCLLLEPYGYRWFRVSRSFRIWGTHQQK